jgi:hypothetical protein
MFWCGNAIAVIVAMLEAKRHTSIRQSQRMEREKSESESCLHGEFPLRN